MFTSKLNDIKKLAILIPKEIPYLKMLVLFGSQARGDNHKLSDWDFAALYDEKLRAFFCEDQPFFHFSIPFILGKFLKINSEKIDVVELNHCSPLLGFYVARDGKLLYENEPEQFIKFQMNAWKIYADTAKFRQAQAESIKLWLQKQKMSIKMEQKIIIRPIDLLIKYIDRLKGFEEISLDEYLNNFDIQLITERLIQLIVETASDLNSYLLVKLHQITPESYFDSFIKAGNKGIITKELAAQLAQSTGMRNILVHQYEDINHQLVFTVIPKAVKQYSIYVEQITNYLNSLEVNNG